jgi:Membrane proteins related to metalloendopeptidases
LGSQAHQSSNHDRRRKNEKRTRVLLVATLVGIAVLSLVLVTLLRPKTPQQIALEPTLSPTASATAAPTQQSAEPSPQPTMAPAELEESPEAVPMWVDSYFDPQRFSYDHNFGLAELQAYLDSQPGPLKSTRFQIGNRSQSFAEVLMGMASLYNFNPKIILALFEQQAGLLSNPNPSSERLALAAGITSDGGRHRGLYAQLRIASVQLRWAIRDYPHATQISFADGSRMDFRSDSVTRYAFARLLALSTTPGGLDSKMNGFLDTYARLFGDPREVPTDWPPPAEPFLEWPLEKPARVTSFFDHDTPFLQENGSLVSYWGRTERYLSYDGHTGWDYAVAPPDAVLAAADGVAIFAGNSNDGCGIAKAVILDHRNGYRTLYWHLDSIAIEPGQEVKAGDKIGVAGSTGCATGPHLHLQVQYLGRDVDPYGWCSHEVEDPWRLYPNGQESRWLWKFAPSPCPQVEHPEDADEQLAKQNMIVIDNQSEGFVRLGKWEESPIGYAGDAFYTRSLPGTAGTAPYELRSLSQPAIAIWRTTIPQSGNYHVRVYVPYFLNGLDDAKDVRYRVFHSEGETEVSINGELSANEWADLGVFRFDEGSQAQIILSNFADGKALSVWADAIVLQRIDE